MSAIESGMPSFDIDFTSHRPRKTRTPCFFVHYVFNVSKRLSNCRLVLPLGVTQGIAFLWKNTFYSGSQKSEVCPMPYALCPMPYALCPMPYAQSYLIFRSKGYTISKPNFNCADLWQKLNPVWFLRRFIVTRRKTRRNQVSSYLCAGRETVRSIVKRAS